ncbi:MAG: hypothetical protein NTX24_04885 [Candidatus Pacearchaeota archaeon]|nr:hypothetical protein [Candidatus Pacearchaeota archaeon]
MKFKISVWTILLILLSIYLIGLACLEYSASIKAEKFYNEQFEKHLNETPALPSNIINMSQAEFEVWNKENTIKQIQNEIDDNWWMDTYISWDIRAKMHFLMALLAILMTILSWRIDLKKKV